MPNTKPYLTPDLPAPVAGKMPERTTLHGDTRTDNYAWLRDENWQQVLKDPDTLSAHIRQHLEAENAYADALTAPLDALKEQLFQEMKGRISEDDTSAPMQWDDYWYYTRTQSGKQYPLYCRKIGRNGSEEVYFDANKAAEGLDFYNTAAVEVSPDHTRLALVEDTNGSEIFTLRVIDIATGKELTAPFSGVEGSVQWAADSTTLFYTVLGDNHRPCAVYRHRVGTPARDNQPVYREKDDRFYLALHKSADDSHILIEVSGHNNAEWHYLSAFTPKESFNCFRKRTADILYDLDYADGWFYILTNKDGAMDFKICACPFAQREPRHWQEVVPHKTGRLIEMFTLVKGFLIYEAVQNANPLIVCCDLDKSKTFTMPVAGEAYNISLQESLMYQTDIVRYCYENPAQPSQVIDFDLNTRAFKVVKEQDIPSGHNQDDYVVRRTIATGHDGTEIPVTLFYHKDTPTDGSAPLWLYGYGAYGLNSPAVFSTVNLVLVNRGFIYAIAHVRGGAEKGYRWYLDGKLQHKRNSFLDFIACAEHLIGKGYTIHGNVYAEGGSAGGLLMGAVINMRPDLWKLVHLAVPFVDVLNTMCDKELPLTPPEFHEWGNPADDEAAYACMADYCPYHNLTKKAYPHTLITSSITDSLVTYWEPAKYAAKMREVNTADTLTIMKMEMATGHGGASGRYDALKEYAFEYAIVLTIFGRA